MKTSTKILHWVPRILVILAILFVSMFALDSFSSQRTFWQNLAALMMHLIPSFILIAALIVAWKWENAGGIALILIGLASGIFVFVLNYKRTNSVLTSLFAVLIVCVPFILAGILFILSYYRKQKELEGV